MRRISTGLVAFLIAVSLGAAPAAATTAKHKARTPKVSCTQIKDAIASGKSADDVAKELKVSATRVKTCTAPAAKHEAHHPAKGS
jgi:hypothetical protein